MGIFAGPGNPRRHKIARRIFPCIMPKILVTTLPILLLFSGLGTKYMQDSRGDWQIKN
jgi:hypothetical protein